MLGVDRAADVVSWTCFEGGEEREGVVLLRIPIKFSFFFHFVSGLSLPFRSAFES